MKYFFSYSWSGKGGTGFGDMEVLMDKPITSWEQIHAVRQQVIEKHSEMDNVTILNFQRFEEE